ncbi:MAG: outer membrane protein beta-barrel protein [Sediminibacterium sp.]|nr:outer membrane protein beta-barrel protein [Sediminibacterium sp.]
MDNKIYQDDELEQFLQEEVKQHRMYPSDHIWKNIRTELHGYRAWPALTFISLFIITALTISTLLNNHPDRQLAALIAAGSPNKTVVAGDNNVVTETPAPANDYFQKIAPAQLTAETFANMKEETPVEPIVTRNTSIDEAAVPVKTTISSSERAGRLVYKTPSSAVISPAELQNTLVATNASVPEEIIANVPANTIPLETISEPVAEQTKKPEAHSSVDEFLKDFDYVKSVPKPRNSKFGFQFYVTPSTSYRRLSDEKVKEVIQPTVSVGTASVQNIPLSSNYSTDVNNVVRHRPAMGFELGFALLYNMSGRLKFKTGVQLNVRQYYIETFQSRTSDLASLSLINYKGVETISFYSPYNNNTGYKKTQLDNKVYQLSIPLGIQWDMIQGKHFGINTEASVQPTMTLNNNTYLLSTDYKHYTEGSDFIRKWNINTSVGLNLTYKSGASSWQIGPQIRYQHLPTYSNLYPIKEYLMDYGIRLGFTHQIK